jgi:hypothetical protein
MSFLSEILEYKAFYEQIAAFDRSNLGRLLITGTEAPDLLERLTTNKIIELPLNTGVKTVITTNKGRMIDLLYVYSTDKGLLVITSKNNQDTISSWIDYYTFGEDVTISNISNSTAMIGIAGPKTFTFLKEFFSADGFELEKNELTKIQFENNDVWVIRTDSHGLLGVDIIFPNENQHFIWEKIMSTSLTIEKPTELTLNTIRINEGIPVLGNELTQDYNPLEAGLIESVNFQKGCYIGQEVIARLNTYSKVKRSLVKIKWDSSVPPAKNIIVDESNKEVGKLTSMTPINSVNKYIGLGYLNKKMLDSSNLFVPVKETLAKIDILIS